MDQGARKLDPVALGPGDLQRVEHEVVGSDHTAARHLEVRLGLAVRAGKHDVHHARAGAAGEKALDRGRHDLRLGAPRAVALDHRPEALEDDVHAVADLGQLFLALHRASHVELEVERDEFSRAFELAEVAHRHDEVQAIDGEPLPAARACLLGQPTAGDLGPDVLAD